MLKFTYKGRFLTTKRHTKNCCIENPNSENMLQCVLYIQDFCFIFKKIKISIFGGISKFLKLIVFGQILTKFGYLGCFGQILTKFGYLGCFGQIQLLWQ
jgi:hypothetical protein